MDAPALGGRAGHREIVELLIAKGADVNAKSRRRMDAPALGGLCGHKEIAELLIANGADVNAKAPGRRDAPALGGSDAGTRRSSNS